MSDYDILSDNSDESSATQHEAAARLVSDSDDEVPALAQPLYQRQLSNSNPNSENQMQRSGVLPKYSK